MSLKSALIFDAGHSPRFDKSVDTMGSFYGEVNRLSEILGEKIEVLFFHDLQNDFFALTVEGKSYSLGEVGKTFEKTLNAAVKSINDYLFKREQRLEKQNEPKQKEKRPSGKKSR